MTTGQFRKRGWLGELEGFGETGNKLGQDT